jgi:16S rRNA (guanine527-N7)-methyltransferase
MTAQLPRARLAELARCYALHPRQADQLARLLCVLAREASAPTSIRSPAQAVDTHVADSLVALELPLVAGARAIVDLGSGAGFPGLPLAIALPRSEVDLLESQLRKCQYLEGAIVELALVRAHVVHSRAEEWSAGRGRSDVALARALAPPAVVLEYAAPLLRRGGALVDWRGRRSAAEERQAQRAAAQLGMQIQEIRRVTPFPDARERHLHVYVKVTDTPARFPRRPGVARKRPLGR